LWQDTEPAGKSRGLQKFADLVTEARVGDVVKRERGKKKSPSGHFWELRRALPDRDLTWKDTLLSQQQKRSGLERKKGTPSRSGYR